jgi:hypothetical protein
MGSSSLSFLSDRFKFFRSEGDRARILLVELEAVGKLGQEISDDNSLGLSEADVVK